MDAGSRTGEPWSFRFSRRVVDRVVRKLTHNRRIGRFVNSAVKFGGQAGRLGPREVDMPWRGRLGGCVCVIASI